MAPRPRAPPSGGKGARPFAPLRPLRPFAPLRPPSPLRPPAAPRPARPFAPSAPSRSACDAFAAAAAARHLPLDAARGLVAPLGLASSREYEAWRAGLERTADGLAPDGWQGLPLRPDRIYAHAGWLGWHHFLGGDPPPEEEEGEEVRPGDGGAG